jgi:hypothetical protein
MLSNLRVVESASKSGVWLIQYYRPDPDPRTGGEWVTLLTRGFLSKSSAYHRAMYLVETWGHLFRKTYRKGGELFV